MSEEDAKALINAERLTLYELISSEQILPRVGAQALSDLEIALGNSGGGGSTDVSLLAKEATLQIIKDSLGTGNLTADWRILTTGTTNISAGYTYLYLEVLTGSATINGLAFTAGEGTNLEPVTGKKHPAITIVVAADSTVRLIGGY